MILKKESCLICGYVIKVFLAKESCHKVQLRLENPTREERHLHETQCSDRKKIITTKNIIFRLRLTSCVRIIIPSIKYMSCEFKNLREFL